MNNSNNNNSRHTEPATTIKQNSTAANKIIDETDSSAKICEQVPSQIGSKSPKPKSKYSPRIGRRFSPSLGRRDANPGSPRVANKEIKRGGLVPRPYTTLGDRASKPLLSLTETTVKEENGNSSSLLPPARYTSATTAYTSATTAYKSATVAEKTGSAVTTAYNSVAAAHVPNPSIVKAKTNSVHSTPANSVPSTHNKESDSRLKSGQMRRDLSGLRANFFNRSAKSSSSSQSRLENRVKFGLRDVLGAEDRQEVGAQPTGSEGIDHVEAGSRLDSASLHYKMNQQFCRRSGSPLEQIAYVGTLNVSPNNTTTAQNEADSSSSSSVAQPMKSTEPTRTMRSFARQHSNGAQQTMRTFPSSNIARPPPPSYEEAQLQEATCAQPARTVQADPAARTVQADPAARTIQADPAARTVQADPVARTVQADPAAGKSAEPLRTVRSFARQPEG